MILRAASLLVAVLCAAGGAFVARHHPLSPLVATALFGAGIALATLSPRLALAAVPALLPLAGLATWTGWIVPEEFDLVVAAVAAGGYLRAALAGGPVDTPGAPPPSRLGIAWALAFAVSSLAAAWIGIAAAGGPHFGWFDGYQEAGNSLRILKGVACALLLAPLLRMEFRRGGRDAMLDLLAHGFAAGGIVTSLVVVAERHAFTGLGDFSSDYRATGPFWEMHVGGAALDGYLALTMPFVLREALRARTPLAALCAAAGVLVFGYACLATFSRGLYVALVLSVLLLALLLHERRPDASRRRPATRWLLGGAGAVVVAGAASWLAFRHGGYRALAALAGVVAIALALAGAWPRDPVRRWLPIGLAGFALAAAGAALALQLPKGAYLYWGLLFVVAVVATGRVVRSPSAVAAQLAVVAVFALGAAGAGVAWNHGEGDAALEFTLGFALYACVVALLPLARGAFAQHRIRAYAGSVAGMLVVSGIVAVFSGGAYMGGRFSTSDTDLDTRLAHWSHVLRLLDGPGDWLLGKGLGRLPANYFYGPGIADTPGSYRVADAGGERFLLLASPRHAQGRGEVLRVAQRVALAGGVDFKVTFRARAARAAKVIVEICEKHLLYARGCGAEAKLLEGNASAWQQVSMLLDGKRLSGGTWFAPRHAFLSVFVETEGVRVDVDDVVVIATDGRSLIANGDFSADLAHWFFTSDHDHLPWHAKNIALNVLFDQGLVGLALFALLVATAIGRATRDARRAPEFAFVAAALVGFLAVGAFDSLLDVPRVACAFYLLVLTALVAPRAT